MENNLINVDLTLQTNDKTITMTVNKVIGEGKTSTVYLVTIDSKIYALKIQSTQIKDISISNISNIFFPLTLNIYQSTQISPLTNHTEMYN